MNITKEQTSDLNALLTVTISPEDYNKKYEDALKAYRKQVNLPGFRSGKVPMGIVKNRFGKALLAEEINKILSDSLQKYISENKLNVLGSPIPSNDHEEKGNWDNPEEFEFTYEIGLAPEFDVNIDDKFSMNYYTIDVDDKILDDQISEIRKRYGKMGNAEISEERDMLIGDFIQLDDNDQILAGGIMNQSTISLEFLKDEETKGKLTGLKSGDEVVVDPHKVSRDHDDLAKMLGITHEDTHHLTGNFLFRVKEIKRLEPAEMNEELFTKASGSQDVKDEQSFREKIAGEIREAWAKESDKMFKRDITNHLVKNNEMQLPDSFLKKYIKLTNEKPVSEEEIEADYEHYANSLKWQLIMNRIVEKYDLKVTAEEAIAYTKKLLVENYARYGMPAPEDQELDQTAKRVLSNQDEARQVFDAVYDEKLIALVKDKAKVESSEVSYDKFVELASKG